MRNSEARQYPVPHATREQDPILITGGQAIRRALRAHLSSLTPDDMARILNLDRQLVDELLQDQLSLPVLFLLAEGLGLSFQDVLESARRTAT